MRPRLGQILGRYRTRQTVSGHTSVGLHGTVPHIAVDNLVVLSILKNLANLLDGAISRANSQFPTDRRIMILF
jgi:hypothetical protein